MKKAGLIIFGLAFGLALLEVSMRLLHYPVPLFRYDSETGLKMLKPNYTEGFTVHTGCFSNEVAVNNFGFHDVGFTLEKPPNTFRIAIVGDSYTQALEVLLPLTFHRILEDKLNAGFSPRKFEIYTFGMRGNATIDNWLYFEKYAKRFKPDLVIDMFFDNNDINDPSGGVGDKQLVGLYGYPDSKHPDSYIIKTYRPSFMGGIASWFADRFVVADVLRSQYYFYKAKIGLWLNPQQSEQNNALPSANLVAQKSEYDTELGIESKIMPMFKKSVEESGSKFLVVSFKWFSPSPQKDEGEYADRAEIAAEILDKITDKAWRLSLEDSLSKRFIEEEKYPFLDCDIHWNAAGHQMVAELMFDFLKSHHELLGIK